MCKALLSGKKTNSSRLVFFRGRRNVWGLYLSPNQFLIILVCNIYSSFLP